MWYNSCTWRFKNGKNKTRVTNWIYSGCNNSNKKNRFNEEFTTIEEVNVMKEVMQKRIKQKELNVEFVDAFFKRYFDIISGVITKADNQTESLKVHISDVDIRETVYDEDFIYLCLCEIMINRITNSMDHTCSNSNSNCSGEVSLKKCRAKDCTK